MSSGKEFMYEVIYGDLLKGIQGGKYPKGSRLPSEKELSQNYGVSRITSKRALEMLANEGLISRMPGRGSFVLGREGDMPSKEEGVMLGNAGVWASKAAGKTIGVILDSFDWDFGGTLLKCMEQECSRRDYNMLLKCTYGSIEEENRAIRGAAALGAQGMILMCAQNETYNTTIVQLALDEFPMVLIDRKMQGIPIPCVKTDNYRASRELTEMLIRKGHRMLCFVTHASVGTPTIRERYDGFADCIMEYDDVRGRTMEILDFNPTPENLSEETGIDKERVRELIRGNEECTAFLCIESKLCGILCRELKELGWKREVVSFDGSGSGGDENVTCYVKQNERELGILAVDTLERIIGGENIKGDICVPYQIVTVETKA